MELINYRDFSAISLDSFVGNNVEIQNEEEFEFMNDLWAAQIIGFTEWLHLITDPRIRSISLDLSELLDEQNAQIISALGLPVKKGMSKDEVLKLFGPPDSIEKFVEDRVSYQYLLGTVEKYYLSLTIQDQEGLVFIVFTNHAESIKCLQNASA